MTHNEYLAKMNTLSECEQLCLYHAEERKVQHCFREADGAMGCFERIRNLMIKLEIQYGNQYAHDPEKL